MEHIQTGWARIKSYLGYGEANESPDSQRENAGHPRPDAPPNLNNAPRSPLASRNAPTTPSSTTAIQKKTVQNPPMSISSAVTERAPSPPNPRNAVKKQNSQNAQARTTSSVPNSRLSPSTSAARSTRESPTTLAAAFRFAAAEVRKHGFTNYELSLPAVQPINFNVYRQSLKGLDSATKEFMDNFVEGEHLHFNSESVKINKWENGNDFLNKLGNFNEVHLFKNRAGLGMEIPDDLDWSTLPQFIDVNETVAVINSRKQGPEYMKVTELLRKFAEADRENPLNMLSLEFSDSKKRLKKEFVVPSFLQSSSMIANLRKALEEKLKGVEKDLKQKQISEEKRKELNEKKAGIKKQFKKMPQYQRFLLLSMEGSFTDVHVDFSASSVYYHVKKGKKVFYVAEPTTKNLDTYKKFEKAQRGTKGKWIGDALFEEWQRIEINEGETAMIPSGYIHFVYTPEDSIVVGGNFLLEKYAERQFELTLVEERIVEKGNDNEDNITYNHMFQGFWDVMYSYLENVFIPELKDSEPTNEKLAIAKVFKKYMDFKIHGDPKIDSWYTEGQKKKILEELKELLSEKTKEHVAKTRKRQSTVISSKEPVAKKKK